MQHTTGEARPSIRDITELQWQSLAKKKIYFGHQSVGGNIIQGIRELMAEDPRIRLTIVEAANPASVHGPALVESHIGRNGDPKSKADEFAAILDRGMGRTGGVAMYKYCYLDIQASTDVQQMFDEYRARTSALRAKYPALTIVHITSPLTTVESPLKLLVKTALGRPTSRDLNAKRSRFNDLLRHEYSSTDPIFDLARVESTRPDGSRAFFTRASDTVSMLAPEYTTDGGHLNAAGRRA
ncbi:MAG: hypothetical protein M3336_13725, partial [Chloroflexota bacterium]|nr:hypothetical protein [Chloroflexota bacterium]